MVHNSLCQKCFDGYLPIVCVFLLIVINLFKIKVNIFSQNKDITKCQGFCMMVQPTMKIDNDLRASTITQYFLQNKPS